MKKILKDRLLIEKVKSQPKSTLLDIVETADGESIGPLTGKVLQKGSLVEDIAEQDLVLFKESDAYPVTLEGKNLFILREYDIIGIL